MQIIPVLDLKGGQVVLARRGQRHLYEPIRTPLSATAEPLSVAAGLMSLHAFRTLYIADLDAIAGGAAQTETIDAIEARFPGLSLWVDAGFDDADALDRFLARHRAHAVIGSESQVDTRLVEARRGDPRVVLSLDFRGDDFQGPASLATTPGLWPSRVIVMTLARVGSGEGPDMAKLGDVLRHRETREIYAAGGVRGVADLRALATAGAAGVLVASALHDGRLTRDALGEFARP